MVIVIELICNKCKEKDNVDYTEYPNRYELICYNCLTKSITYKQ